MPVNSRELVLLNELQVRIESNFLLTKSALCKVFKPNPMHRSGFKFSFEQSLNLSRMTSDFNQITDVDKLSTAFLMLLNSPFGVQGIDNEHVRYIQSRTHSKRIKANHSDSLFSGTSSRSYQNGFSNHAYTFGYYLSTKREYFSTEEIKAILELFYYGYIKENYHSFCEVHAAFLRASENYNFPALAGEDLLAPESSLTKLETHKQTFSKLLERLEEESKTLSEKKDVNFSKISMAANTLYQKLKTASKTFFDQAVTIDTVKQFEKECKEQINLAILECKKDGSFWDRIHPIIKGILGVLALIAIIPAIVFAACSSYTKTFFDTPPQSKKLHLFQTDYEIALSSLAKTVIM